MDKDFILCHAAKYAEYQNCDQDEQTAYANWYWAYYIENDYMPDHSNVFWDWEKKFASDSWQAE